MPEGNVPGPSGQQTNRAGKGKNKDRERSIREESEGDSKDNLAGNGTGTGNASEGKGGSGINRVNRESEDLRRICSRGICHDLRA